MGIVADASVFLAVILNESDREWVVRETAGKTVVSPEVLPYEIGNALIAMRRKGRLHDQEVLRAFDLSQRIIVKLIAVDIHEAIKLAMRFNVYAYDAYYLRCCVETKLPLVSLDNRMCDIAGSLGIKVMR